jgi:hypothetical protein
VIETEVIETEVVETEQVETESANIEEIETVVRGRAVILHATTRTCFGGRGFKGRG